MNILITGAGGFIGYHLASRLLESGFNVIGTIRRAGMSSADSKQRLKKLEVRAAKSSGKLQIVRCEEYEGLYNMLQKLRPEVCVHLAGKSSVRESINNPELYQEANYRFTASLLETLRRSGCRRVIYASSVMVYGGDAPVPYQEDQIGSSPLSPYGASKLAGEVLVNTYSRLYKIEAVTLRLFSAYGPHLRRDCVPYIFASAILQGQPLTVFGDGSAMRDYIEIEDVVNAFQAAILGGNSDLTLNVGSGFGTSTVELIHILEKALKKKAKIIFKPAINGELNVAVPDISQAMNILQWEPKISLEAGAARMAAWFKSPDAVG
jgi:UDP-glucuronate 4-epimerase